MRSSERISTYNGKRNQDCPAVSCGQKRWGATAKSAYRSQSWV